MSKQQQDLIAELIYDRAEGLIGESEGDNEAECNQLAIDILDLFKFSDTRPEEEGWYWYHGRIETPNSAVLVTMAVYVFRLKAEGLIFCSDGYTFYVKNLSGLWAKALAPRIPEEK